MKSRFAWYAWGVLVVNILVILWGALVRATGSGAGCGAHWPRCNGDIIPIAPSLATIIEFAHRASSGVALLAVAGLLVWAFRAFPARHRVRRAALASMLFILLEALIGAALVLLRLVAHNTSLERGFSGGLHLVNSLLLLAALVLTAWYASGGVELRLHNQGLLPWLFGAGLVGALFLGASGAIAALGDTLFPVGSLAEGLQQDFSGTAHLFVQLRVFHPIIAVAVGAYSVALGWFAANQRPSRATRSIALALTALFGLQFVAGLVTIVLLAPVAMQLVHLLLADLVWISMVLGATITLATSPAQVVERAPVQPHYSG